jgi:hypothetical protein
MDGFLTRLSFSMAASAVGIFLSVVMTMLNTFLNPERIFIEVVNRFEYALEFLWQRCDSNLVPADIPNFDENRDAIEALAEYSVAQEIAKHHERIEKLDSTKPVSDAVHQTAQNMMLSRMNANTPNTLSSNTPPPPKRGDGSNTGGGQAA